MIYFMQFKLYYILLAFENVPHLNILNNSNTFCLYAMKNVPAPPPQEKKNGTWHQREILSDCVLE